MPHANGVICDLPIKNEFWLDPVREERRAVDGHAVAYPRSHPSMKSFERHGDRSFTFSLPRGEQTAQNPSPVK